MGYEIGERVGAICGAKDNVVSIFGFGVYEGMQVPDVELIEGSPSLAVLFKEIGMENPCILLDSGERVYGCECWWAPEEHIKNKIEEYKKQGYSIETVSIEEMRKLPPDPTAN